MATPAIKTNQQFTHTGTEEIIKDIYSDMLLGFYDQSAEPDAEFNHKIEKAWSKANGGVPFLYDLVEQGITAIYLHGGPGHGKTTSFKVAAQQVGEALGLEVLINPDGDLPITKKHLLFISHELSGINSAIDFAGLPVKKDEHMGKLPSYHFAMLKNAKASVLLLDDFANASPAIQNVALSISEEGRFQELNLGNTYVGITGNMGAADNTHASKLSSALRSRCRNYQVEDSVNSFCERIQKKYSGALNDAGMVGFLRKNEEIFSPSATKDGSFPCPRTWEKLIKEMVKFVYVNKNQFASQTGALGATLKLQKTAESLVGFEAGARVAAYYNSLLSNAAPLADEMLANGKFSEASEKMFAEKRGDGFSGPAQEFSYQFAMALADSAVSLLSQKKGDKDVETKVVNNFSEGLAKLDSSSIMFSVSQLMGRLKATETLVNKDGAVDFAAKQKIIKTLNGKKIGKENMTTIVDALSGFDSYRSDMEMDATFGLDM